MYNTCTVYTINENFFIFFIFFLRYNYKLPNLYIFEEGKKMNYASSTITQVLLSVIQILYIGKYIVSVMRFLSINLVSIIII